jgi:hypothetical protein
MTDKIRRRTVWGEGFGWDEFDPIAVGADRPEDVYVPKPVEAKPEPVSLGVLTNKSIVGLDHTSYVPVESFHRMALPVEPDKGIFITHNFTITVDTGLLAIGAEEMARQMNAFFKEIGLIHEK